MLELQLEAFADAAGAILSQQRREWSLEHAVFVAEHKAMLADLRRENAELQAALKAAADEQKTLAEAAVAKVKDGEPGPAGKDGRDAATGSEMSDDEFARKVSGLLGSAVKIGENQASE